jgi:hypothetical protein
VAESVTVTGETPVLESVSAGIGLAMDERRVADLPTVGGNPFLSGTVDRGRAVERRHLGRQSSSTGPAAVRAR